MDATPIAPDRAALFLDFDGTLVEIAPRPDAVVVPAGLPGLLRRLAARCDGAVAVVSGRRLEELDAYLGVPLPMAGEHGAVLRPQADAEPIRLRLPVPPAAWLAEAAACAARFPGTLLEPKPHGFALHYRLAPEAGLPTQRLLEAMLAGQDDFVLLPARMAWEVKPRGVSKGGVVRHFMAAAPFAGRVPVFIGDDVTDEAGMEAARAAGGIGLRLQDAFGTPARLHEWLRRLAAPSEVEAA